MHQTTPNLATEPGVAIEPAKATKAKTKCKISSLKLRKELLNELKNECIYIYIYISKYLKNILIIGIYIKENTWRQSKQKCHDCKINHWLF